MRVIQSFLSRSGISMFHLKQLYGSAIQWKFYRPLDTLTLYCTEEILKQILNLKSKFSNFPWADVIPIGFEGISPLWYDCGRFIACKQQNEPFIFLDADAFLIPETDESLHSFFENLGAMFSQECEVFGSQYTVNSILEPTRHVRLNELPAELFNSLPGLRKYVEDEKNVRTTNTGVFYATPSIAKKIGENVTLTFRKIVDHNGNFRLHEFASGTVPVFTCKQNNVEVGDIPESVIFHLCSCRNFPVDIKNIAGSNCLGVRRYLTESVCTEIMLKGGMTRHEFGQCIFDKINFLDLKNLVI